MSAIDLSLLPPPSVVEPLDFETILAAHKATLLALHPDLAATLMLESEPVTKILEAGAYHELLLRQRINDAARAVMLAYATGSDLDHLAALLGVARLTTADDEESDDRLRLRTQMAIEGETSAGSRGSYVFHALSASALVKDVSVDSPTPGAVRVAVLSTEGDGTPSADLVAAVAAYLSAEDRRPLTDTVTAEAAEIVPYAVEATLYVYPGPAAAPILTAAQAAVDAYVIEHARLGHDITISGLYACLHQPGVQRVALSSPASDVVIASRQASHCTGIAISIGATDV